MVVVTFDDITRIFLSSQAQQLCTEQLHCKRMSVRKNRTKAKQSRTGLHVAARISSMGSSQRAVNDTCGGTSPLAIYDFLVLGNKVTTSAPASETCIVTSARKCKVELASISPVSEEQTYQKKHLNPSTCDQWKCDRWRARLPEGKCHDGPRPPARRQWQLKQVI